jgi:hypothetical protein
MVGLLAPYFSLVLYGTPDAEYYVTVILIYVSEVCKWQSLRWERDTRAWVLYMPILFLLNWVETRTT